jgi:RNA polymerase sigma factor (sigma-70 family)
MKSDEQFPSDDEKFEALIIRVRQGDESAARELVERYERAVLRTVRVRLGKSMRNALDSMDIVQSVHRSLLIGLRDEKYQFASSKDLIALAVVMVQRKVARHWRKLKKLPRSRLEPTSDDRETAMDRIPNHEPTASLVVSADEQLKLFLSHLDQLDQELVRLRLNGHSSVETARLIGRDPAYVRMRWARLRKALRDIEHLDQ